MAPKFGTSGLRGLVTELTPDLVRAYTRAFLTACPTGGAVHVGWDLRPSSPDIADSVIMAVQAAGLDAVVHGALPTPALALASLKAGQGAVMITGSHIPADRNGLKFYTPMGEISKDDEAGINANLDAPEGTGAGTRIDAGTAASDAYVARYADAFGADALSGMRIGVYQHSSVARDIMVRVVQSLGAVAVPLERSDIFIPVDTEAVDPQTRAGLAGWCSDNDLDALISTDGDADRPMVADAQGTIVPGDVLGPLTARALGAAHICTPVSSNTLVAQMEGFDTIDSTRIGSPFVIAAMETALAADPSAKVVGYEANGGFLLGFAAAGPAGPLAPLMTRDCLLPILAPLAAAKAAGQPLADLAAALPARFTAADRLTGIEIDRAGWLLNELGTDAGARAAFFDGVGAETGIDLTDGLRVSFDGGDVIHLRPSGNAPEFRCYTEAASTARAEELLAMHLDKLGSVLKG